MCPGGHTHSDKPAGQRPFGSRGLLLKEQRAHRHQQAPVPSLSGPPTGTSCLLTVPQDMVALLLPH